MSSIAPRRRLSAGQERLWFLQRFNPDTVLFNEHVCVRLRGVLREPALRQAVAEIARRHESLRWVIEEDRGRCVAVARAHAADMLRTADLTGIADDDVRERFYRRSVTAAARQPFDLTTGPLLRLWLFRLTAGEYALAAVTHHIISDSWSMQVFVEDVCSAYRALVTGAPLEGRPVDYGQLAEAPVDESHIAYWTRTLANAPPPMALPSHRPRPAVRAFTGGRRYFTLDADTTAAIGRCVREERITPFILLLALWKVYLGAASGRRDLVIGTAAAGRQRRETDGLIGFLVNTLAIRSELRPAETFRRYLRHVRDVVFDALDHQHAPFDRVVQALQLPRSSTVQPLFEVMVLYLNTAVTGISLPDLEIRLTPEDIDLGLTKFDIVISFSEHGEVIQGLIDYSSELYDASEIEVHVARFQRLAAHAIAGADRPIRELLPMDPAPLSLIADLRSAPFAG